MGTSIDPIEYDVRELRELARVRGDRYVVDGFLWTELPDSFPPAEWSAAHDRPSTWGGSLDERQKPYLRRLPDGEAGQGIAQEWVHELVERAGSDAAVEALAYYESLGWLTEPVREDLEDYLLTAGYRPGGSLDDLSRTDHVQSLARTARLAQLAEPDRESPPEGEPRPESARHAEFEPRSGEERHPESDTQPASDEDQGWMWGRSTAEDRGWEWGGPTQDGRGWMWGRPTEEDEETLVGRDEERDAVEERDAEATSTTLTREVTGTDDADEDGVTVSGFEFGAKRE